MVDSDDKLLRALGAIAADEARVVEAAERVARGEASDVDGRGIGGGDALEALRPLGPEVEAMIAASLAEQTTRSARRSPWRRRAATVGGALLLAAGLALVLRPAREGELPRYTADARAMATTRGPGETARHEGPCVLHAREHGDFELTLTPATAVREPLEARAFVQRGPGLVDASLRVELSPDGAVLLSAPRALVLGASELRVVLGRPARMGEAPRLAREGGSGPGWLVVTCAVTE